ncbi:MAG: ornithine carbamoyltransferase [Candidatus Accumulibacter sp.]|nr:ornithine carbamoyltransferase [Accumulibacter sp.]
MSTAKPAMKHYLQFKDLGRDDYAYLFERARWIKGEFKAYRRYWPLADRTLVMIFEKASTRTRLSFEAGMQQLGGMAIYLNTRDSQLGRGEPIEDSAQVISRMSDVVMIRTYEQGIVERFAANSRVPVINGLTNEYHPCQIMADIFTYIEHRGPIQGKTVAWIGDSNNVCHTWLQAAEVLGFEVRVATPPGYEVEPERAGLRGAGHFRQFADPMEAVRGVDIVTTDVWTSMGFEAENEARMRDFADYRVDGEMMRAAHPEAIFLHCLPAHRGEEVTAEVIDGPQSFVWDEAENRMHVQKALLEYLLLGRVNAASLNDQPRGKAIPDRGEPGERQD